MTGCTHDWTTIDPTGGDPAIGGPVAIVVCGRCGMENRTATAMLAHGRKERAEGYAAGLRDAQDIARVAFDPDDADDWTEATDTIYDYLNDQAVFWYDETKDPNIEATVCKHVQRVAVREVLKVLDAFASLDEQGRRALADALRGER